MSKLKRKIKKKVKNRGRGCKACGGTGRASNGGPCIPCQIRRHRKSI